MRPPLVSLLVGWLLPTLLGAALAQGDRPRPQRRVLRIGTQDVPLVVVEAPGETQVRTLLRFRGGRSEEPAGERGTAQLLAALLSQSMPGLRVEAREEELRAELVCDLESRAERSRALVRGLLAVPWRETDPPSPGSAEAADRQWEGAAGAPQRALERARAALEKAASEPSANTSVADLADAALLAATCGTPLGSGGEAPSAAPIELRSLAWLHGAQIARDRLVVGISGPAGVDEAAELWTELLQELPPSSRPFEVRAPAYVQPPRRRIRLIDRPAAATVEIRMAGPGTRFAEPDFPALDLWSALFGAGGTGLLSAALASEAASVVQSSAGFQAGWSRKGLFLVSLAVEVPAAADALTHALGALERARETLTPEGLDRARRLVEARYAARSATPGEALELATDLALHGLPEGFVEQHLARIQRLDVDEVGAALERHLQPDKLSIVVVGPSRELTPRLADLGELETETSLVEELLAALGGRDAWARTGAVEAVIEIEIHPELSVETRQWHDLAGPRFRVDTFTPSGTLTTVLDGDRAWQRRPEFVEDEPPENVARILLNKRRRLWDVLHSLATLDALETREEADGSLTILRAGVDDLNLVLDEARRPASISYEEDGGLKRLHYSDWRESGGLWWPAAVRGEPDGPRYTVKSFRPSESFDGSLLAR